MKFNKVSNLFFICSLFLLAGSCSNQIHTADVDTSYYRINGKYKSEDKIDNIISPYKAQLDAEMNEVIAINPEEMQKKRPNSALGNWFCDVLQEAGKELYGDIDFTAQNYGGLRVPALRKGEITVGNIFELMPFDNKLVVLELKGSTVKKLLDRIAEKGGWPISKSLSFTMQNDKASNILINGIKFDQKKTYNVALPDYIANGGDQCFFLKDSPRKDSDKLLREILINYLKNKKGDEQTIQADSEPRIKAKY